MDTVRAWFPTLSKSLPARYIGAAVNAAVLAVALCLVIVVVAVQQIRIHLGELIRTHRNRRQTKQLAVQPIKAAIRQLDHPCLAESAVTIASKIRNGDYTSAEVVNAFITHAERVNVCMNVICDRRYDAARAEAKAVDAELRLRKATGRGLDDLPAFYGVPCSIKEFFAMAGMLQTAGVITRKAFRPDEDATPVKRLRSAGFIVLMNTNTSELGMWYASDNPVWGRSNNAYDHRRIVGGSSGGEAALISAGGVPVGIGSDIGGSIRIPAGFNGVFGHKPTGGLIPNSGQYPTTHQRFMVTGPICRYSADLWPMVQIMRGPDSIDTSSMHMDLVDVRLPLHLPVLESASPAINTMRVQGAPGEHELQANAEADSGSVLKRLVLGGGSPIPDGVSPKLHVVDRTEHLDGQQAETKEPPHHRNRSASLGGITGEFMSAHSKPAVTVTNGSTVASVTVSTLANESDVNLRSRLASEHLNSPEGASDDLQAFRTIRRPPITEWSTVTVWMVKDLGQHKPKFSTPIEKAVEKALYTAADTLIDVYGCKGIRYLELPELEYAFDMWAAVLGAAEQPTFRDLLSDGYGGTIDIGWELLRWCFGAAHSTLPALILGLIEDIPAKLMPQRQKTLIEECRALKRRISEQLSRSNGILLIPMHPTTAPLHDVPLLRPFNVAYTQIFNVTENPSTVIPIGLDSKGLPVSVQAVAAHGYDRLSIAAAQALEHAGTAGWIPPQTVSDCKKCSIGASVAAKAE